MHTATAACRRAFHAHGALTPQAASFRAVRGQTHCLHCRGTGRAVCSACQGAGIVQREPVRMNQVKHAGAWGRALTRAGGCAVQHAATAPGPPWADARQVAPAGWYGSEEIAAGGWVCRGAWLAARRMLGTVPCWSAPCLGQAGSVPAGCGLRHASSPMLGSRPVRVKSPTPARSRPAAVGKVQVLLGMNDAKMFDNDWMKSNRCGD